MNAHEVEVDGRTKGDITHFVNHDCKPNCRFIIWNMNDERALVVVTLQPIPAHSELTLNYGTDDSTFLCVCQTFIQDKRCASVFRKQAPIKLKLTRSTDSVFLPSVFWKHQDKTSSLISVLIAFSMKAVSPSVYAGFRSSRAGLDNVPKIFHSLRDQLHTETI